ncbi:DUF3575 domain-containing protein [Flavobacteriaceae bacterium]|nr:DUF3575 domain-containing protein [Flavobacteriaceae bacterium]
MKHIYLVMGMLLPLVFVNAQNDTTGKKNEVKLNLLFPLSGTFEATYERILNKKSSLGISFHAAYDSKKGDEDLNYSISPYYRRYFGKKYASGFFLEGFTMLNSTDGKQIRDRNGILTSNEEPDVIDMSLGIGLGNKWVTKKGFIYEVNVGYGKLLFNADKTDHDIVARFGFHFGYRF